MVPNEDRYGVMHMEIDDASLIWIDGDERGAGS